MIITEVTSAPVETNAGEATRFKIKASARAFKILSSFYADPIMAIPRELGANAWDAHVKAGNTQTPFEVHVPNALEPWFSIRDFGTGLSEEDVRTIYTTYFESTKASSNDFDGCMGLGSKTPFNYTENFSVISYFDGVKYVYNCFVDEGGGPSILLMAKEATMEPNGMFIRFAVKKDDISTFEHKIKQAFAPFRAKPVLKGTHNISYPEIKYTYQGTDWGLRDDSGASRYGRTSAALMGNYRYPIDSGIVASYSSCKGITPGELEKARAVFNQAQLDFMFEIGDLDVAPNKETLQYDSDDRTRAAIIKKAVVAYDELSELVKKTIASPASLWEAMKLYYKFNSHHNNEYYSIRYIIGSIPIPFNGKEVTNNSITSRELDDMSTNKLPDTDYFSLATMVYNSSSGRFKIRDTNRYSVPSGDREIVLFYTDSDGIKRSRVRKYLLETYTDGNFPPIYLIVDKSAGFARTWNQQAVLGIDKKQYIHIESLPKVVQKKVPGAPKQPKIVDGIFYEKVESFSTTRAHPSFYPQTKTLTADDNGTYYYIPMKFATVYNGEDAMSDGHVAYLLQFALGAKLIPDTVTEIYGVNVKTRPIMKVGKWINILDLAIKKYKKSSEPKKLEQKMFLIDHRSNCSTQIGRLTNVFNGYYSNYGKQLLDRIQNKESREFFTSVHTFVVSNREHLTDADRAFAEMFGIKSKQHSKPCITIEEINARLNSRYLGLFNIVDGYQADIGTVANLINFFDENNKTS